MKTEFRSATPWTAGSRHTPGSTVMPSEVFKLNQRDVRAPAQTDALVIDASLRQALVTIRALGRSGLRVGTAESPDVCDDPRFRVPAFASRWTTWNSTLPDFHGDPATYARFVLDLVQEHPTRVVIPCSDGSIAALRPWRSHFERRGVTVALASESALDIANNKPRTLSVAQSLGIAGPRTAPVADPDDARAALAEVRYPAVIKPTESWVRHGCRSNRMIAKAVVNEVEALAYIHELRGYGSSAVVQQWVGGLREAVNLFYANGRVWAEMAQVAYRTSPVLGGTSVVRETIPMRPDLRSAAVSLVQSLDLEGYSEVEFRRDASGRPLLMEINARLTGGMELAIRSGVDFPTLLWRWAAEEPLAPVPQYRSGVRIRFLAGDFEWLWENLKHRGRPDSVSPSRATATFARDFLRPQAYDYLDRRDLRPALVAVARDIGDARRRLVTRKARKSRPAPATATPTSVTSV
jgi:predicted ATP-grasp superfamily ATP-dependent carboligase